mgnify:CR=1 FL=1
MYLFFDTETTGLPKNWKAPVTDLDNWPRMIQIGWTLCNEEGERVDSAEFIIKPDNFIIPREASNVHGITTEKAEEEGVELDFVLNKFNELVNESKADILILSDANIIFKPDTIPQLIAPFTDKVGAVGGRIIYDDHKSSGISQQEDSYLQLENRIKSAESNLFKSAMGLEGGCYAIKRELFPIIPPRFFMEDFYVSLSVIEKGYQLLFNANAVCIEDVSTDNKEEFKRKVRISIGNFQNLERFKSLVFKRFNPVGFSFLSHKILRWFTPFFLILLLLSSLVLQEYFQFFLQQ